MSAVTLTVATAESLKRPYFSIVAVANDCSHSHCRLIFHTAEVSQRSLVAADPQIFSKMRACSELPFLPYFFPTHSNQTDKGEAGRAKIVCTLNVIEWISIPYCYFRVETWPIWWWLVKFTLQYTGLILHRGKEGDCLHAPWSMPSCPWNAPVEIFS